MFSMAVGIDSTQRNVKNGAFMAVFYGDGWGGGGGFGVAVSFHSFVVVWKEL